MKVKVKKIKRASVSDVEIIKSKIKIKSREFCNFAKAISPEAETITLMCNFDTGDILCFTHKDRAIDDTLSFDFGGLRWNA